MNDLERIVAYHESGHAVASFCIKRRFKNITIIPNKESLGKVDGNYWSNFKPDQVINEV